MGKMKQRKRNSHGNSPREREKKAGQEQLKAREGGIPSTQISEREIKGKCPGTTATPPHAETMSSASNQPIRPKTKRPP